MIIYCDVDCTIADLMPEWIRLYNNDFSDNLCVEAITEWDMTKFVVPACGDKIYTYLTYGNLYDNVKPIKDSVEGVRHLRRHHRVIFLTSGIYCVGKFHWLEKHGFEPGRFGKDFIVANDKSLVHGDVLIDDGVHNVEAFTGACFLFDQPWNRNIHICQRVYSWNHIVEFF